MKDQEISSTRKRKDNKRTNPEMTHLFGLSDKDFKAAIMTV